MSLDPSSGSTAGTLHKIEAKAVSVKIGVSLNNRRIYNENGPRILMRDCVVNKTNTLQEVKSSCPFGL
jgi:hypothetical protein